MPPAPRALCLGCRNLACKRCRTPTPAPALLRNSGGTPGWGGGHTDAILPASGLMCTHRHRAGSCRRLPGHPLPARQPAEHEELPHASPAPLVWGSPWSSSATHPGVRGAGRRTLGLFGDFAVPQGHCWGRRADPGPTLGSLEGGCRDVPVTPRCCALARGMGWEMEPPSPLGPSWVFQLPGRVIQ